MGRKRWGDRRDGRLLRELDAPHFIMGVIHPNRADSEACLSGQIDLAPIKAYLAEKNTPDVDFQYTLFHVILTALVKTVTLRPRLNRFIVNGNCYQRSEVTSAFVVQTEFSDRGEERTAFLHARPSDTLDSIRDEIRAQVRSGRDNCRSMDVFNKLPRFVSKALLRFAMFLDKHGWLPESFVSGDPNYSSVLISGPGSIGLRCGCRHLSNWGTASLLVVIGEQTWTPVYNEQGFVRMTETLELGLTVDARIADGDYCAKSIRLLRHLLAHPALLERPLAQEVDYA